MDPFELLKNDHRKVATIFDQIESAPDSSKTDLFSQLKNELDLHASIEETLFYPRLEDSDEARDITMEAYEEHNVVKSLLAELEGFKPDEQWSAKLAVLRENVEHHVQEEEGELFTKARQALTKDELDEIGNQIEAAKRGEQAEPPQKSTGRRGATSDRKGAAQKGTGRKTGLLGTLATIVGLGSSASDEGTPSTKSASRSSKTTKKSSTKASGKSAKGAAKKSTAKKSAGRKVAAKKAAAKGAAKKRGTKRVASKASGKGRSKGTKKSGTKTRVSKSSRSAKKR